MNNVRSSIEHLPSSTKAKLRSTQILTSLPQLVSELVQNSLDASARSIDVTIDPEEWECCVRDDGVGIPKDGLAVLAEGSEAGRYGTSKAYTPASLSEVTTFGFRGEALASIADLCCLEISSRTKHARESSSIILKGGRTLYSGSAVRWRKESHGTVVSVRDAFYNLPIRRKSHPPPSRIIELIKRDIESFALMFPNVSFSLENAHHAKGATSFRKARVLSVPKTSSTLATFRHLYGKALADHVEVIDESHGEMRLDGFISLEGAFSKGYQFMYVNKHPLEVMDLQRSIEAVFARSSFSKHAYDESGRTSTPRSASRRSPRKIEKRAVYVLNLSVPPKQVDNCIEPKKAAVQLQNTATATMFVSSVVESILVRHGFLLPRRETSQRQKGSPSPRKKRKVTHASSLDHNPFSHLFHRSISQPVTASTEPQSLRRIGSAPEASFSSLPTHQEEDLLIGIGEGAPDIVWTDPATGETFIIDARTGNSYPQNAPTAVPSTSDTSALPSGGARRTLTLGTRAPSQSTQPPPAWITEALRSNEAYQLPERKIPVVATSADIAAGHACDHGVEQGHSGPVRSRKQAPSRHLSPTPWDTSHLAKFTRDDLRSAHVLGQVDRKFIACTFRSVAGPKDLYSDGEHDTGVNGNSHALVLIDQHAADERIRVERFLKDICEGFLSHRGVCPEDSASGVGQNHARVPAQTHAQGLRGLRGDGQIGQNGQNGQNEEDGSHACGVRVRIVNPPAQVLLTRPEATRVADSHGVRAAFARWGVVFTDPPSARMGDGENEMRGVAGSQEAAAAAYVQVAVAGVPEVVADKLLSGNELRDLVKGFLAKLEHDGVEGILQARASQGISDGDDAGVGRGWQKALRWCPQELVDLVNSKACRGAIMFNDTLTLEQCKTLVLQLSETALPFQCAHGRPSLVPVVETGGGVGSSGAGRIRMHDTGEGIRWARFMRGNAGGGAGITQT